MAYPAWTGVADQAGPAAVGGGGVKEVGRGSGIGLAQRLDVGGGHGPGGLGRGRQPGPQQGEPQGGGTNRGDGGNAGPGPGGRGRQPRTRCCREASPGRAPGWSGAAAAGGFPLAGMTAPGDFLLNCSCLHSECQEFAVCASESASCLDRERFPDPVATRFGERRGTMARAAVPCPQPVPAPDPARVPVLRSPAGASRLHLATRDSRPGVPMTDGLCAGLERSGRACWNKARRCGRGSGHRDPAPAPLGRGEA